MIRAQGLAKRFGGFTAVRDIDFSVQRGEVVGFLGPNGAGKSTTMRMLVGRLVPDEGVVEIAGSPLQGSDMAVRRRIGYLPESTPLYASMRADRYLEFVARTKGIPRRDRREALRRVASASDLYDHLGRRIDDLSKGYKQRVGLAQALLGDPDVLVLDEPTSGLDPNEVVRIRELVRELGRTRTVLLSTHVLSEVAELCPRVLILSGGQLVADGTPDSLAEGEATGLVLRVRGAGSRSELEREVRAVAGVDAARASSGPDGATTFQVDTTEPAATAPRLAALVAARKLELVELRHVAPTLEQVFARCTASRDLRFDEERAGAQR